MLKIDKLYIKESKRIIDTYDELIEYINDIYSILESNKEKLFLLQADINNLEDNDEKTKLEKFQDLQDFILTYDKEVVKLKSELNPYIEKIEQVKKDSSLLYKTIKENYPNISDEILQKQIQIQILEL